MEQIKALIIKVPGGLRVGGAVMRVFRRWQARRKAEPSQSAQKPSSKSSGKLIPASGIGTEKK